ncbi:MAG: sulfotransferase domain-containing protein [Planctomycetota bacterium]
MKPVCAFHIGARKAASSWIYRCLAEHPGMAAPSKDSIHYFDMFYARGEAWYASHFDGAAPDQIRYDPTPSYLSSSWAPRRIRKHNADARIAMCLRNPIERAFSHYWHEKKKGRHRYAFREILSNYDLFTSWLGPGFYAEHLSRYFECFPRDQILVQRFEDVDRNPARFLRELVSFFGADPEFVPSALHTTVNMAGPRHTPIGMGLYSARKAMSLLGLKRTADQLGQSALLSGRGEYLRGIPEDVFAELLRICEPEIIRLEDLLQVDLSDWRRPASAVAAA